MAKILHWIFGPHMFDVAGVLCIGTGVAAGFSTDLKEISASVWFFGFAAVWALGRAIHWLLTDPSLPLFDPLILTIADNESHFPGAWFLIYRMKAHESRDIVLRLAVRGDSAINVSSSILNFEATPQPLIADKGRVMYRMLDKWIFVELSKPK